MKEIPLTKGKVALVDDADYEAVMQFKWQAWKSDGGIWYAVRAVRKPDGTKTTQRLHQFLMPGIPMIDHKDGNGLNNLRENLRPCTQSQNMMNRRRHKDGSSRFKGVSWFKAAGKWMAQIWFQSKKHYLGYFNNEEDAARAYDVAAKKFHKEFARLNFPSTT